MNTNSTMNGYKGNGLSDQPLEVQRLINSQWDHIQGQSRTAGQSKFFDPTLINLFGGLIGQVINAFVPQQKASPSNVMTTQDATKFIDPALLQMLASLLGQAIHTFVPQKGAVAIDKGEMRREYVLQHGHFETFPTWSFWGETHIRLDNTGELPTTVLVGDQRFHLNPGEGTTTSGRWAAFPVRVTNTSELPGAQVTVRVW